MKELFYIKGDPKNPEDVEKALLEKYPDAIITCFDSFNNEKYLYYVNESNDIVEAHYDSHIGEILKRFGTEIFPKKKQEFEEKVMYQAVTKRIGNDFTPYYYAHSDLFETIQEVLDYSPNVYGYIEVKVKLLKK